MPGEPGLFWEHTVVPIRSGDEASRPDRNSDEDNGGRRRTGHSPSARRGYLGEGKAENTRRSVRNRLRCSGADG